MNRKKKLSLLFVVAGLLAPAAKTLSMEPAAPTTLQLLQEAGQNFGAGAIALGKGLTYLTHAGSCGFKTAMVQHPKITTGVLATCLAGAALRYYYSDGTAKLDTIALMFNQPTLVIAKDVHRNKLYLRDFPSVFDGEDAKKVWIKKLYDDAALYKAQHDANCYAYQKVDQVRARLLERLAKEKTIVYFLQCELSKVIYRYSWCPSIWGIQSVIYPEKARAQALDVVLGNTQKKLQEMETLINTYMNDGVINAR